jgi:hypothetical protein
MKTRLANLIQDRSTGLVAIVVYKAVVTVIFSMAAISLFTTASEYNTLQELANEFKLSGKHRNKFNFVLTYTDNPSMQNIQHDQS